MLTRYAKSPLLLYVENPVESVKKPVFAGGFPSVSGEITGNAVDMQSNILYA